MQTVPRTLVARRLVTAVGVIEYPILTMNEVGTITDISTDVSIRSDATLTATFFDIHIHGSAGYDVMQPDRPGLGRMGRFLAAHGVGHYLPTSVTAPIDDTLRALEALADAIEGGTPADEATPLGIHLEGPFLSHAKRGVHPADLLQPPSIELFDRLQAAARGHVRLLTIAPEVPGALQLIAYAAASGVRVSLGHTNATRAESQAGMQAGACSATHLFNGMRALDHREPGIVGELLDTAALYTDVIADGIHVDPLLVRLALRLKGEQLILISDAIAATGMPDGRYSLGPLAVEVRDGRCTLADAPGTLAGSVLTLDRAVRNLQQFTGAPLEVAVRSASSQPAAMLGLGATLNGPRVGQPANLNQYSAAGVLEATYLRGVRVRP